MLEIWRRSDSLRQEVAGAAYELDCWSSYIFISDEVLDLPPLVSSERPGTEEGRYEYDVNFQDFIGVRHVGGERVRVTSAKLDDQGFDRLLADLTASVANLPFDFKVPTFVPHERVSVQSEDVLYHAFAYLRWAMFEAQPTLSELLARIAIDPHRQLVHCERTATLDRARRMGPREISRLASGQSSWRIIPSDNNLAATALAIRVKEMRGSAALPEHVRETIRVETVDTPENRFVKYFLSWLGGLTERIEVVLAGSLDEATRDQAVRLRQETTRLSQAEWLNEVGEMRAFPANSQVLQRKHGYRELLAHYLSLVMASRYPIAGEDLRRILEVKSASVLYEYWVFFEVVRSVERAVGFPPTKGASADVSDQIRVHLDHGVSVQFGPTIEVIYNRGFSGGSPKGKFGSYSLPLRPDVLLRVGEELYVFDAKFRVERAAGWKPSNQAETEEAEMLAGESDDGVARWFKAADIHKMHTYRDAVRHGGGLHVSSAWAIYPGNEFRFYSDMEGRVVLEGIPAEMEGVGAIPLEPMGSRKSLDYVVSTMLASVCEA